MMILRVQIRLLFIISHPLLASRVRGRFLWQDPILSLGILSITGRWCNVFLSLKHGCSLVMLV